MTREQTYAVYDVMEELKAAVENNDNCDIPEIDNYSDTGGM